MRKGSQGNRGSLKQRILKQLNTHPKKGIRKDKIIKANLKNFRKDSIETALEQLIAQGRIESLNHDIYRSIKRQDNLKTAEGVVDMTKNGYAFIISKTQHKDVFVSFRKLKGALDGDKVKIRLYSSKSGRPEGEVMEIQKRSRDQFIGTVHIGKKEAFLVPENEQVPFNIYLPGSKTHKAKNGEKAIVRITDWGMQGTTPEGEVIEILGQTGINDVEMKSILIENGFSLKFPEAVLRETGKIKDHITPDDVVKREDLRGLTTFTIDPADAKDFDDALSVEYLENGNVKVGVHIADVSHYVNTGTALDEEASDRATSVYLVDRVLPMFPEKISNEVCSLRPNEDKLCFSVIFELDDIGKVVNVWYGKTVIYSDRRFTYEEAQESIESGKGEFARELQSLNSIAKQIRMKRIENGSIPFETVELRFKLNKESQPIGIILKEVKESNKLIEEYMLLANKYVALYLSKLKMGKRKPAAVYRVHDHPDAFKLEIFSKFAKNFGYQIKFKDKDQIAEALNRLIEQVRGKKEQNVLEQLAIRSMAKAEYTTNNIGHYGLAFTHYTHFTSPIRRYPDVLVHRILHQALQSKGLLYEKDDLEELCQHSSQKERDAMKAERESLKYKQVEYMMDKIGNEYDGIISGVIYKGIFIELTENKCEGFIPVSGLGPHQFTYEETNFLLKDILDEKKYQLGGNVRVKIAATNLENRTIDMELIPVSKT